MRKLFIISLLLLFCGCSYRMTDFTILSSKNIDLSKMDKYKRGKERVTGIDKIRVIIFIPTGMRSDLKEALDRAIEQTPGCVGLVDGVVHYTEWYIPFFYGELYYTVEGTPLIDPTMAKDSDSGR